VGKDLRAYMGIPQGRSSEEGGAGGGGGGLPGAWAGPEVGSTLFTTIAEKTQYMCSILPLPYPPPPTPPLPLPPTPPYPLVVPKCGDDAALSTCW
jgi:hypothetical protein